MTGKHDLLKQMAENLRSQDNACTANPIFVVQQRRRVYGFDPGYSNNVVYMHDEGFEVSEEERQEEYGEALAEADEDEDFPDFEDWCEENYTLTAYQDFWDNVQPFFTRAGAEEYVRINGHNLKDPRVYVDSAFRNAEWQAVRELLMSMVKESE
jgi:hypothetical protein